MNYAEFFTRYGGSLRTKHLGKRASQVAMAGSSGLPKEMIRLDPWEAAYLWGVASSARLGILETGRYRGGSTFLLACAARDVPTYSIDIAPKDDGLLRRVFADQGVGQNVELIVGDSTVDRPEIGTLDVLFIDGDHSYQGCASDIATWHGRLGSGGHIVFHDSYRGSYGVQQAIADFLAQHPEFEVVVSPLIDAEHWKYPAGSIAHLVKR